MEIQSRLHPRRSNRSGRRIPTLVGIRPFKLRSASSLDHLESTTIQHTNSWSSSCLMELTISSISVLVLVLVATALAVVGSITLLRRYLIGGLVLSAFAPVVYTVAINYVTMNYCLSPFCFSGPVGSESVSGLPRLGVVWGFQIGFYVFLVAVLVLIAGLIFNSTLTGERNTSEMMTTHISSGSVLASCSKCGAGISSQAKYCSNCGQAGTPSTSG